MAETESYKQERGKERERARDSMAHCPLLEKATGSGPSTVSFLYFLRSILTRINEMTAKYIFVIPDDQI